MWEEYKPRDEVNKATWRRCIERFSPILTSQTWGSEILVAQTGQYTGKILLYQAGKAGGLQLHQRKDETFVLWLGEAWVDSDDGSGEKLMRTKMLAGESFHIPPGAPHRFEAITDCVVFEASTPVFNDRIRLEDEYGVPVIGKEYGLRTTKEGDEK